MEMLLERMFRIIEAFHNDDENSKRTSGRFIESTCSLLKFEFPPPPSICTVLIGKRGEKKREWKKKEKKKIVRSNTHTDGETDLSTPQNGIR